MADDLCIGCGFCQVAVDDKGEIHPTNAKIEFDEQRSTFLASSSSMPKNRSNRVNAGAVADPYVVCPGRTMRLNSLYKAKYPAASSYLGSYLDTEAAYCSDNSERIKAASGGIASALVKFLLEQGIAERAYMTRNNGPRQASAGAYMSLAEVDETIHDSIYHPTDFGAGLQHLVSCDKPFVFVGLPCEVAALEILMQQSKRLASRCRLTIGLFCGGINRLDGIEWYIRSMRPDLKQPLTCIRYREGYWPGHIKAEDGNASHIIARIKGNSRRRIIKYIAAFQGFFLQKRCRICPDQVAHLADIAVGDPHLPRFQSPTSLGVSAVVVRTERGQRYFDGLKKTGGIKTEALSATDIIESQGYTLKNRSHSVIYVEVARKLGMAAPSIEDLEINDVDLKHRKKIPLYATIDLLKIKYRDNTVFRRLVMPLQIAEYLFIRFTPSEFFRKLRSISKDES